MADAKSVAEVIQSALDEIGVTGKLDVKMDGETVAKSLDSAAPSEDVHVSVEVEDIPSNDG